MVFGTAPEYTNVDQHDIILKISQYHMAGSDVRIYVTFMFVVINDGANMG